MSCLSCLSSFVVCCMFSFWCCHSSCVHVFLMCYNMLSCFACFLFGVAILAVFTCFSCVIICCRVLHVLSLVIVILHVCRVCYVVIVGRCLHLCRWVCHHPIVLLCVHQLSFLCIIRRWRLPLFRSCCRCLLVPQPLSLLVCMVCRWLCHDVFPP